jgi:hypothetical protein
MMVRPTRPLVGALVSMAVVVSGACGGSSVKGRPGAAVGPVHVALPALLAGLDVKPENAKSQLAGVPSTYLRATNLYSLRKNDLVEATLQVSQLESGSRFESTPFRQTLVNRIGGGVPVTVRMGASTVYLTQGVRQNVAVWFRGSYYLVLTSRIDFDQPRTLLRAALGVTL